jgi:serine/threonine-protein kinase
LADRYRIDQLLGDGGMGVVYRAEHVHMKKRVAIKVLHKQWSAFPEIAARFEREAIASGNINSPHVAAATDFGRLPDGRLFLALEFVEGRTLRDIVTEGPIPEARALAIARGIAAAAHAAHKQDIVHRDLKPENVMLTPRDGESDFVKVLDFGVAKVGEPEGTPNSGLTQAGALVGTPDYMSPEQALGQSLTLTSDIYSIGVILYEMLSGRCPYLGEAVVVLRGHVYEEAPELPAGISEPVRALVRRAMQKKSSDRFASAQELIDAIDACGRASVGAFALTEPPPAADAGNSPAAAQVQSVGATPRTPAVPLAIAGAALLLIGGGALLYRAGHSAGTKDTSALASASASASAAASSVPAAREPQVVQITTASAAPAVSSVPTASAAPTSSGRTPASQASAKKPQGGKPAKPAAQPQSGPTITLPYIPPPSEWFKSKK